MATFRLEFDEHGEPLLVEERNGSPHPPVDEWIERFLSGTRQMPKRTGIDPDAVEGQVAVPR